MFAVAKLLTNICSYRITWDQAYTQATRCHGPSYVPDASPPAFVLLLLGAFRFASYRKFFAKASGSPPSVLKSRSEYN
jgi:hypothetical protein